ncbi:S41 family peptidase [Flavobacterium sp. 245]|uniref:S41 family peptidase n=1 Tax=Flavobacterium sp. 245 TaxID=2512115 RepID=UPI00106231CF|nr:S41 family peptidase [Flavobacterium sp. 245]TDP03935.1 C-terminal processing protease CtpA/Prc [Flavobacterium sp. 245]
MQRITLLVLVLFSQVIFSSIKITETEKLAATCKVWGFLKYYHPKVANGDFNWDQQLLDILPKIEKAQTQKEYALILENWIDDLGPVKEIAPIAKPKDVEYFDKNFDLSWINSNKLFSKNLSKKLKFIEQNRFQGEPFYVYTLEGGGNIGLKNESNKHPDFTDKNSKLRMVFMYWNLVEYFFPDKYLMDQKWDITLEKTIPLAIKAENQDDFYLAMRKMVSRIDDSHTEFFTYSSLTTPKTRNFFPAHGKIIDEKLVITEILADSLAQADDIKVGTIITKINDKTIREIIAENRDLICASNEPKYLDKLAEKILRSYTDDLVKVEFFQNENYVTKTMTWYDYHDSHRNEFKKGARKKKEKFKLLENNIGYVNMGIIDRKNIPDMIEALKNTKAIIFDMRNYPKGTFEPIGNFLNPQEKKFAIYTLPDLTYPGRCIWSSGASIGFDNKDYYKGKAVLLLDEKTQSQAEWTAMCFQTSGNTTIVGSQTAGADGNISIFDFEGFNTQFSGIGVFYPDKRETQRIGIVPDIEAKQTIKGIQEGRDEVLDRALLFVESGK